MIDPKDIKAASVYESAVMDLLKDVATGDLDIDDSDLPGVIEALVMKIYQAGKKGATV